jgi:hypothetical protein
MGSAALTKNGVDANAIATPITRAKTAADAMSETDFVNGANNKRSDLLFGLLITV